MHFKDSLRNPCSYLLFLKNCGGHAELIIFSMPLSDTKYPLWATRESIYETDQNHNMKLWINLSINKSNRAPVRSRVRPEIPQYSILFSLFHILQRYIHRNLPDSSKLKHRYQYICAHAHGKHFRVNLRFQIQGQPAGEGGHQITVNSMYGPGG